VAREHGDAGKGGYWRVDESIAKEEIDFNPKAIAEGGTPRHALARTHTTTRTHATNFLVLFDLSLVSSADFAPKL
jgi:hypothetical protein